MVPSKYKEKDGGKKIILSVLFLQKIRPQFSCVFRFHFTTENKTELASAEGAVIQSLFFLCFGDEFGNGAGATIGIECDEGIIGLIAFVFVLLGMVFSPDFHVHFYGCVKGAADLGFDVYDIAELDGVLEGDVVDGGGDDGGITMFAGGEGCGDVHPVHEATSHQVTEYVGVIRQDQFGHDNEGFFGRLCFGCHHPF